MSRQASGLMAWAIQRATAIYLALFLTYLVLHLVLAPPADYLALRTWIARPSVSIGLLLLVPTLLAHAWVGIRDVLIDYVHRLGLRFALMAILALVFVASGLWAFKAILVAGLLAGAAA
jgi:succinate dehydrogenase / fumarate reductase membrane anchor subunit